MKVDIVIYLLLEEAQRDFGTTTELTSTDRICLDKDCHFP